MQNIDRNRITADAMDRIIYQSRPAVETTRAAMLRSLLRHCRAAFRLPRIERQVQPAAGAPLPG